MSLPLPISLCQRGYRAACGQVRRKFVLPPPAAKAGRLRASLGPLFATLLLLTSCTTPVTLSPAPPPPSPSATPAPVVVITPTLPPPLTVAPTTPPDSQPSPALPPRVSQEWNQDAHDAQRTGYSSFEPLQPWTYVWSWNGPDASGSPGNHFYDAPPAARPVAGAGLLFVPAGEQGLYALHQLNGTVAWHFAPSQAAFNAAPAFDPSTGRLYAAAAVGEAGALYALDPSSGQPDAEAALDSPIQHALLLGKGQVALVTASGDLHALNTPALTPAWAYAAGSPASTPPAHSARHNILVFGTADLAVHGVDASTGTRIWRAQPSPHQAEGPVTFEGGWPVIADTHGVVFVRLNLGMAGLWSGPGPGNMYPSSNAETRQYLQDLPELQTLFALDILTGGVRFIPAVGFTGVESLDAQGRPTLSVGAMPVIRITTGGDEVAYLPFRSAQGEPPDGRWDSHLGEMVLDDNTIAGMQAGDLRFIQFDHGNIHISDESCPLTMAGETVFHAHWGASESARLLDRSPTLGLTAGMPITTEPHPTVIRRQQICGDFDPITRWTHCDLTLFEDGRFWKGPGWWVYWNTLDPPTPAGRSAYSDGLRPRYTFVTAGYIFVVGNGGDITAFRYGSP